MSRIVDAATAVLLCRGQMLVLRRQPFLKAFPGFYAFPGGKVDEADAEGTPLPAAWADQDQRLLRAMLRELREELDLDLCAAHEAGQVLQLRHLGVALTPPAQPLRFNTHFFLVELAELPQLTPDNHEVAEFDWATPQEWRRRYEDGQIVSAPPSVAVMQALARDIAAQEIPDLDFERRTQYALPVIEAVRGVRHIWVRSHTIPPAQHTNCFLLGDAQSHRILVDPSPHSDEEMERLLAVVEQLGGVHEIFLTHHHPDHRERANVMARRLQVPMGMSVDTHGRIFDKAGAAYFQDLSINHYQEGDVVCRWQGRAVHVYEVPGHDQGQLALMPEDRAWCIVSDLIQGVGTVVIAKPEGHMGRYFKSLQRIIDFAPKVIFPSHGTALGTVYRLQETLDHRRQREQQVLSLHHAGKSVPEMLPLIYAAVDPRLMPLAQMNIESHLDKLREEGVIPA